MNGQGWRQEGRMGGREGNGGRMMRVGVERKRKKGGLESKGVEQGGDESHL